MFVILGEYNGVYILQKQDEECWAVWLNLSQAQQVAERFLNNRLDTIQEVDPPVWDWVLDEFDLGPQVGNPLILASCLYCRTELDFIEMACDCEPYNIYACEYDHDDYDCSSFRRCRVCGNLTDKTEICCDF